MVGSGGGSVGSVGDIVNGFSDLWVAVGGHVVEGNVVGHLGSHTCCEGSNLLVNVLQKGVGGPAAMLLDGDGVNPIEVHSHGATSTEGVTTDTATGESILMQA